VAVASKGSHSAGLVWRHWLLAIGGVERDAEFYPSG
jgi:hypothetical protein